MTNPDTKPNYKLRRKVAAGTLIAGLGGLGVGAAEIVANAGPDYSQSELSDMPQHQTVVGPKGIDTAILQVDPKLSHDGQGLHDVEGYVRGQLPSPDHIDSGVAVSIPVIPGEQTSPSPTPSETMPVDNQPKMEHINDNGMLPQPTEINDNGMLPQPEVINDNGMLPPDAK